MAKSDLLHKGFAGSHEVSIEDNCLIGRVLFIEDIVTYEGDTVVELKANFEAAVDRYLDHCKRTNMAANKPYSGTFNVRVGPELHREAVVAAHAAGVALNEYVSIALSAYVARGGNSSVDHNHHHVITIEDKTVERRWSGFASQGMPELLSATTIQ